MTYAKTASLKANPNNPRAIRKGQLNKLVKSLQEFPEMLEARPIVIDKDGTVLGGNMRLQAAQIAGMDEVPVYVREWDETKDGQFVIRDNVSFGEWDMDILANEWEAQELEDMGVDIPVVLDEASEKDLSESIVELYRVEVVCTSEEEQEAAYNAIIELGYECRLLTL